MSASTYADGNDLDLWASRRDTQSELPRLLRRLIHATVDRVESIGFPADEAVQMGGWDGIVKVPKGNAWVSDGVSVWELGVTKDVKGKADDDYNKRTSNPLGLVCADTTFVFVTPRRWGGKDSWVASRRAEGKWRDVRAYDADDLVEWLEAAPSVHVWLSILVGKHPAGVVDLSSAWIDWTNGTSPILTPDLVICGRNDEAGTVRAWFNGAPAAMVLKADSRKEAVAFFAASVYQLPADERIAVLSRTVIAEDIQSWRSLQRTEEKLLLVPRFSGLDAVTAAVQAGHHVFVPLGRDDAALQSTVILANPTREDACKALEGMGLSEAQAQELAPVAKRSMTALRRRLAAIPEMQQPAWAKPQEAAVLLPALFSGCWNDANEADIAVISKISGRPYDEFRRVLSRWSNESDPPARQTGDAWVLVSWEDSWRLLARYIGRSDWELFQSVALEVLGELNPTYDMPTGDRWLAGLRGKTLRFSNDLRRGLAESLAAIASRGGSVMLADRSSPEERARHVVLQILRKAHGDSRLWASLSDILPLIAEAAPAEFLDAVGDGLTGDNPVLMQMFADDGNSLTSMSPHTGLLWALETVAWSGDYLSLASSLLAKLDQLDPGGKTENRPVNSLVAIFRLWMPQTSAMTEQRTRVLDMLRQREPDVAWKVMLRILPQRNGFAMPSARPHWREWAAVADRKMAGQELWSATSDIVARLLSDAGNDGPRWCSLLDKLSGLPETQVEPVIDALLTLDVNLMLMEDRSRISGKLRTLVSDHRSFADADWAFGSSIVDRLEEAYLQFLPKDSVNLYGWLFSGHPHPLKPSAAGSANWQVWQQDLDSKRIEAVTALVLAGGLSAVRDLAIRVEQPWRIGDACGGTELISEQDEDAILMDGLAAPVGPLRAFACGFIASRFRKLSWAWVDRTVAARTDRWTSDQRSAFYECLPFDRQTWDSLERHDADTIDHYWTTVHAVGRLTPDDCTKATRALMRAGRAFAAVDLLSMHSNDTHADVAASLILEALEQAVTTKSGTDEPWASLAYSISDMVVYLEASGDVDDTRLATLEMLLFPVLEHNGRGTRVIHRELGRDPAILVALLNMMYLPDADERHEPTTLETTRARFAFNLLEEWRTIPGADASGSINARALSEWVTRARALAAVAGRSEIVDHQIGRALSFSPITTDGTWPDPVVCDLFEALANTDVERGFEMAVYNRRGVVHKSMNEGGDQERELSTKYQNYAGRVLDNWPRTAAMLRRIGEGYKAEGNYADVDAAVRDEVDA